MTVTLHTLTVQPGSRRRRRRVGRGNASRGSYSGRGAKGQRSRTGGRRGLIRRSLRSLLEQVPKRRGFASRHPKLAVVNVGQLESLVNVQPVTSAELVRRGLIASPSIGLKVLGGGKLTRRLTVQAQAFSASARRAIEAAGGTCVVLGMRPDPSHGQAKAEGSCSRS